MCHLNPLRRRGRHDVKRGQTLNGVLGPGGWSLAPSHREDQAQRGDDASKAAQETNACRGITIKHVVPPRTPVHLSLDPSGILPGAPDDQCHSVLMATPTHGARLAVLIDADNASAQHPERLLVEIAKYGTATVRRAYGDWTSTRLATWKPGLLAHSVQPIQQFSHTTGKNSTDSALIIDAMDLLHGGTIH